MEFYRSNVVALGTLIACLSYRQYKQDGKANRSKELAGGYTEESRLTAEAINTQFKRRFFPVYLLVVGADWLQGPYIYTMYKDEKGLAEVTVGYLFLAGFLSAAISASFVGSLADRHGRRAACLIFCITCSLSCFTILSNDIIILFLGRVLGGLSTTLMYSVFESWMVTEYHRQHLDVAGGSLKDMFGTMTTLNGVIAVLAGVFAQGVADVTRTQKAPFLVAVALLVSAFLLIFHRWNENYGDSANTNSQGLTMPEKNGFRLILDDRRLWALSITSCFFEGTMYLWVFFKFPALKLCHKLAGHDTNLPFGMIFAALMCAMMLGSLLFSYYSSLSPGPWVVSPSKLLMITLTVASACFIVPVIIRDEAVTFWCFCIFEICCGIYYPTMSHQKEKIVHDGVRAKIYGILRMPLNIFVVVVLSLTRDGVEHRDNVFMICSGVLIVAATAVGTLLD